MSEADRDITRNKKKFAGMMGYNMWRPVFVSREAIKRRCLGRSYEEQVSQPVRTVYTAGEHISQPDIGSEEFSE